MMTKSDDSVASRRRGVRQLLGATGITSSSSGSKTLEAPGAFRQHQVSPCFYPQFNKYSDERGAAGTSAWSGACLPVAAALASRRRQRLSKLDAGLHALS